MLVEVLNMQRGIFSLVFVLCVLLIETLGNPDGCPNIISRDGWGARSALQVEYSIIPIEYVIIHHTVTPTCSSLATCSNLISNIQNFHMNEMLFHDIGYNFLIGGDGNVYEGAGWHKMGAHTRGYNSKSIGVAFIGNFVEKEPAPQQLEAAKKLLACGVNLGELDRRYKLIGARQVSSTQSPGLMLYRQLMKWSNFVRNPKT